MNYLLSLWNASKVNECDAAAKGINYEIVLFSERSIHVSYKTVIILQQNLVHFNL